MTSLNHVYTVSFLKDGAKNYLFLFISLIHFDTSYVFSGIKMLSVCWPVYNGDSLVCKPFLADINIINISVILLKYNNSFMAVIG